MGKITGYDNFFDDGKTYYDENGNKITAYKNVFDDGVTYYDQYGQKVGTSYKNFLDDGVSNYDASGKKVSSTYQNMFDDGYSTYNTSGQKISSTYDNFFDNGTTTYTYGNSSGFGSDSYGSGYFSGYGSGYGDYSSGYGGYSGYTGGYSGYSPSPRVDVFTGRICNVSLDEEIKFEQKVDKARNIAVVTGIVFGVYCLLSLFINKLPWDLSLFTVLCQVIVAVLAFLPGFSAVGLVEDYISAPIFAVAGYPLLLSGFIMKNGGPYWASYIGFVLTLGRTCLIFTLAGLLAGYPITINFNKKKKEKHYLNKDLLSKLRLGPSNMSIVLLLLYLTLGIGFNLKLYIALCLIVCAVHAYLNAAADGFDIAGILIEVPLYAILICLGWFRSGYPGWPGFKAYLSGDYGLRNLLIAAAVLFISLVAGGISKDGFKTVIYVLWGFSAIAALLPLFRIRLNLSYDVFGWKPILPCFLLLLITHLAVNIHYKTYAFSRTFYAFLIGSVCLLLDYLSFGRYYYGFSGYFTSSGFIFRMAALLLILFLTAIPSMVRKKKS